MQLTLFLELFTTEKNELILTQIKTPDRDHYLEEHKFWKWLGNDKSKRNYNTVKILYVFMQKLLQETIWDEDKSYVVRNAFLKQPKITIGIIKAMCVGTEQTYLETERDINFFNVIDGLVMMGLSGSTFIYERVVLIQEMANVNEALLVAVDRLKKIV